MVVQSFWFRLLMDASGERRKAGRRAEERVEVRGAGESHVYLTFRQSPAAPAVARTLLSDQLYRCVCGGVGGGVGGA